MLSYSRMMWEKVNFNHKRKNISFASKGVNDAAKYFFAKFSGKYKIFSNWVPYTPYKFCSIFSVGISFWTSGLEESTSLWNCLSLESFWSWIQRQNVSIEMIYLPTYSKIAMFESVMHAKSKAKQLSRSISG